jgi:membrane protease YdiL (CAAX protease family)
MLLHQVLLSVVLAWLIFQGEWTARELGIRDGTSPALAVITGLLVYFLLGGLLVLIARSIGMMDHMEDATFEVMRSIWPREPKQKQMAFVAVCVLNPVTEELLYRGVLVFALGQYLDSFFISSAIGFALSLSAHWYQGTLPLLSQTAFHLLAIGLVLSPIGLLGSMGLHFAADLMPVLSMRRDMTQWANRRRKRRGTT